MRQIQQALANGELNRLSSILLDMRSLWDDSPHIRRGMYNRRGDEARLIEAALADGDGDPCNQKTYIMTIRAAMLSWLMLASLALGAETWEGTYRWDNENQHNKPGGVTKYVSLRVSVEQDGKVVLSCAVFWKPGMDADFGAVVERKAVFERSLEGGTTASVIPFIFEDSNDNKGNGEVEIHGSSATLKILNTEIHFPEAARQYGTYQLQKE